MELNKRLLLALLAATTVAGSFNGVEAAKKRKSCEDKQSAPKRSRVAPREGAAELERYFGEPNLIALVAAHFDTSSFEDMQTLLRMARSFSGPDLGDFLRTLIENHPNRFLPVEHLFGMAVSNNDLRLVREIFSLYNHLLSVNALNGSLQMATVHRFWHIAAFLITHASNRIAIANLRLTLQHATNQRHKHIIALLLIHAGDQFSDAELNNILQDAATRGYHDVVALLSNQQHNNRISDVQWVDAFNHATPIIKQLLFHSPIASRLPEALLRTYIQRHGKTIGKTLRNRENGFGK